MKKWNRICLLMIGAVLSLTACQKKADGADGSDGSVNGHVPHRAVSPHLLGDVLERHVVPFRIESAQIAVKLAGHRDGGQVGGELMRLRQQGGESGTLCHAGGGF